jgi:hypothetical protein
MSGIFSDAEMMELYSDAQRKMITPYKGRMHMLIADLRGMKTLAPSTGKILGEWMTHHRSAGLALCVHISDESVQRLQVARIARQNSPNDDITVDVVSIDEAHRVVDELRGRLDDRRYAASIR